MLRISFYFLSIFMIAAPSLGADLRKLSWSVEAHVQTSTKFVRELEFRAPPHHHFNEKAPSHAEAQNSQHRWLAAAQLDVTAAVLTARWTNDILPCPLRATLFICDDKETYCLPKTQKIECAGDRAVTKSFSFYNEVMASSIKPETLFIVNDAKFGLASAKKNHLPLLIDFYGVWCPPCNQLDETVFASAEFNRAAKAFVLLKLDADSSESWVLKSRYKVAGYPTVIFADEDGGELSRIVGARTKDFFIKKMSELSVKNLKSFEIKKQRADRGEAQSAYELGLIYLDRQEYEDAHFYLFTASRSWRKDDIRNNDLLSATLGIYSRAADEAGKKLYLSTLEKSLNWYPHVEQVFARAGEMAELAEAMGDQKRQSRAYVSQVGAAQWFLNHPRSMANIEETPADFYEVMGDSFAKLGKSEKSKQAYKAAAAHYLAQIKKEGLSETSERAYNLERLYCLWKSGDSDLASRLYEKLEKVYPHDFTFFYQHAKLLQSLKKTQAALDKADTAMKFSYGDNRLRVTALAAQLLSDLNRKVEAVKLIDQALVETKLPDDLSIRTHRYYDALKTLREKI